MLLINCHDTYAMIPMDSCNTGKGSIRTNIYMSCNVHACIIYYYLSGYLRNELCSNYIYYCYTVKPYPLHHHLDISTYVILPTS
jgi:hypothetical protein